MKKRQKLLTDEQWELIEPLLPEGRRRKDNRGRPWASNRACFEGILWILQTGAAWRFLPDEFPSPATCWRRLKQWQDETSAGRLASSVGRPGWGMLLKWDETFLDGSFAPAKKGAMRSVKPSAARERSGWYWSTVRASAGSSAGKCLSGRSYACGSHAKEVRVPRPKGRRGKSPGA